MEDEHYQQPAKKIGKLHNTLPLWGNEASMNLNPLILANIQGSSYFKVHLFKLKTYHEVVDEIYYQVKHTEPWERGSRKTSGQTGMCGGVRGVGAGGIVSTAFCLLYKLYTLRLTRKQVNGLLNHTDSPYIRALGFMYLRYTQPPADLYDWYEDYLQDEEEIDVKAGGGQTMTIGQMVYQFLTKLDWFSTLFPRIPVPIQKQIEKKLEQYCRDNGVSQQQLGYNSSNRGGGAGKVNALPVENETTGRGSYAEEEYEQRRSRGSGSRAAPPVNYRSEHDDREPYRERRRDYAYDYKESVRDYERARERYRERDVKHSRDRSRERDMKHSSDREYERSRERDMKLSKDREYEQSRERDMKHSRDREIGLSREREMQHSRDREPLLSREREPMRSRERDPVRSREREHYRRDYDVDRRDDYEKERTRVPVEEKEEHRDKHKKKKKKHKHHRSRSRSHGKRDRKRERDNGDEGSAVERRYR